MHTKIIITTRLAWESRSSSPLNCNVNNGGVFFSAAMVAMDTD